MTLETEHEIKQIETEMTGINALMHTYGMTIKYLAQAHTRLTADLIRARRKLEKEKEGNHGINNRTGIETNANEQ